MSEASTFANELKRRGAIEAAGVHFFTEGNTEDYWSNLSQSENAALLHAVHQLGSAQQAMQTVHPELYDIVYSPKRQAGFELLDLCGDEIAIDYGCMWGALTIPLARRIRHVLGIDQTEASLNFLAARQKESGCDNVTLLRQNLKTMPVLETKADVAIVNGVLEWIPEEGPVALKQFFGTFNRRTSSASPRDRQLAFLRKVHENLRSSGKLYLAIENRFDLRMFLGYPDPHANLFLTSVLPRALADSVSRRRLGRPYVNWIYSFPQLEKLLREAGFSSVALHTCFPDYRYPQWIAPYAEGIRQAPWLIPRLNERGTTSAKRLAAHLVERIVLRFLNGTFFSPSIIAIAQRS